MSQNLCTLCLQFSDLQSSAVHIVTSLTEVLMQPAFVFGLSGEQQKALLLFFSFFFFPSTALHIQTAEANTSRDVFQTRHKCFITPL